VADAAPGAPVRHGLDALRQALKDKGVACETAAKADAATGYLLVIAGLAAGAGPAAEALAAAKIAPPTERESLVIQHADLAGRKALIVCGADDRGLMYALLDVADRIAWAADPADPLSEVRDAREKPAVAERALSIFTMQRAAFEARFFDEKYWAAYFDTLARNRFNTFTLIFGYEAGGYMAPAYPYFFDVEGYPDVRVPGLSKDQQQRSLRMLNRVIEMAHERGLSVILGLWDHIYRGGVQSGGMGDRAAKEPTDGIPWGVTEQNLVPYTQAALAKFLREVRGMDAIQFRMHDESGLKPSEMHEFWGSVFDLVKRTAPLVRCDLRAKGLPDSVIDLAVQKGLNFRITTKYLAEQMGMPFHPTHVNKQNQHDRRHGYSDLLRYPVQYKMIWRLWNGGTSRVLLWGDPEYVRRFAESTRIYPSEGYEVNEPLAMKMASHPHDMAPLALLTPDHRYTTYEFERYWHFFQVWGRVGYNPDTPPEVWQREFQRRFGKDAAPFVEQGLHRASQILPRIMSAVFPYSRFPMTRGWVEKQRWEDLPVYAKAEGSDTQQFASFDEEARLILDGEETAKVLPSATSRWLARASEDVLRLAGEAEKKAGPNPSKEFVSTITDLRILGNLALYHSRRIPAGVAYAVYKRSHSASDLDEAIAREKEAAEAWAGIVAAAGDVYSGDLAMGLPGAGLSGHWRDELAALKKGIEVLERERDALRPAAGAKEPQAARAPARKSPAANDTTPPAVEHTRITTAPAEKPLAITARVTDPSGVKWVRLRYRSVNQYQDFKTLPMLPAGEAGMYKAVVPAEDVASKWDFMYLIEVMDNAGNGKIFPDLEKETPYVVVHLER
ncbi:MAG: hypothetical protein NT049_09825, partial [Planctomycetota bacterium]|nr:hypothetical protein [Planctomycetota bacterium]